MEGGSLGDTISLRNLTHFHSAPRATVDMLAPPGFPVTYNHDDAMGLFPVSVMSQSLGGLIRIAGSSRETLLSTRLVVSTAPDAVTSHWSGVGL